MFSTATQTIQVQITDQPLLPSNIEAMVWREWVNDYDFNGQPSPDEYESFSNVLLPLLSPDAMDIGGGKTK